MSDRASPAEAQPREFHYRIAWRTRHPMPGHHRSARAGPGHEYSASAPLLDYPDPRRLDLRTSLRDPFEQLFVRVFNQYSAVPVYAVVDLSASMSFAGARAKLELVREFLFSLAFSAGRTGDPFGLIGCAPGAAPKPVLAPTRSSAAAFEVIRALQAREPVSTASRGLGEAAALLGGRRALVFVVSDFHFPVRQVEDFLEATAGHEVMPVVVWDSTECRDLPSFGLVRVRDSESASERYVLMRAALRARIREGFERRWAALRRAFMASGSEPLLLMDRLDADAVTGHFAYR